MARPAAPMLRGLRAPTSTMTMRSSWSLFNKGERQPACSGYRLGAVRAAAGGSGDIAEALRARLHRRRLGCHGLELREQLAERQHHQKVDGGGNEKELDQRIEEVAVLDLAAVDVQHQVREIGLVDDRRDHWIDQVGDQRIDDRAEGRADHNGDRQIDYVATKNKVTETFQHRLAPLRVRSLTNRSHAIASARGAVGFVATAALSVHAVPRLAGELAFEAALPVFCSVLTRWFASREGDSFEQSG